MQVSRRSMLRAAGGTAAAAALSPAFLAGCSKKKTNNSTAANTKVKLPSYIPYTGVKPDLPGDRAGVDPAYFKYPANPVHAASGTPGKGGTLSGFANIYAAVPPALGRNTFWKALNKALGVNLTMDMIAAADYTNKLATLVAGNDVPDLVSLSFSTPSLPQLLSSRFTNLTEYLAGDSIKEYPFLANLPTDCWRRMVYDSGIYGLPIPRSPIGSIMFVRDDIVKAKGFSTEPKSFAEFREMCKGLTDKKANKFAIGLPGPLMGFLEAMLGKPNGWVVKGGKFTSIIELDETRKALAAAQTLYKDGSFHPDSFSATTVQAKQWMFSGTVSLNRDGYRGWSSDILGTMPDREHRLGAMVAPGYDGGPGTQAEGNSSYGIVGVKKASKANVKNILHIANWLAAPFGTAEYLLRKYGVADVDYTLKGTDPVLTQRGTAELSLPVNYLIDAPDVIYAPGESGLAKKQHAFFAKQVPLIVPDPTVGLYSQTNSSKGASLNTVLYGATGNNGVQGDVIQGRKSLKDWDNAVKDWQNNGGNQIRSEYEKAYEELHGHQ